MNFREPTNTVTRELFFKKSRFIAIAMKINNIEDIKALVSKTKAEHPNANHVVHAAIIGNQGTIYSYSDDREPKIQLGDQHLRFLREVI